MLCKLADGSPATAAFADVPHSLLGPGAGVGRNSAQAHSLEAFFIRHFIAEIGHFFPAQAHLLPPLIHGGQLIGHTDFCFTVQL